MYDDTFNPLGMQGGGVRPSHEGTLNKVSLIFSS